MSLKKKLGMGVASAALGLSLIGGGTFAYFSDKEVSNNTFAAGTLDLTLDPTTLVDIKDLKPGDKVKKEFLLKNSGSLAIKDVQLATKYTVNDLKKDNAGEDFGEHIKVNFIWNWDKQSEPVYETTLAELQKENPDVLAKAIFAPEWGENGGLAAGTEDYLWVEFEFEDKGDQNKFQGDSLNLEWTFNAHQGEGEAKE
ncbi:biofilm matrix protein CalY [Bacillus paranthracis]|uniref:Biofilm matrix protein CalY n=3 Tax=Bacillus cereus group TaxID=86661 RepID=A0A5M9GXN1_9BACI|nr:MULTISPECIES: biofilm matrix protein CalY [Bacillus]ACJ77867.1 camelysin [Bacillus cereus AH187]EEL01646.1 Camelysin; Metallo peptidase; MEROPS family M73 [Bacillus cereus BDRD-ST26]EJP95541.1 SipW-cognate class signal peptide [Bacillus cereus IS075]EJQ11173.1 SipW-cognate class signal peptide [Bacillus cereus AND1407]EJR12720.1 SipW-cognate class signal peptide [Bacillus cereus MSX-A12]EOO85446.1 SipW-cognate class signal peptide [Bacillus cereus IS845/00]EOO94348.1 SipW-cognate class si